MIRLPEEYKYDEYLYASGDTVYWLSNGSFGPLYVFSASVNQKWIFPPNNKVNTICHAVPMSDTAIVRSTQVKIFDGKSFNTQYLDGQKKWNIGNTIIKSIGSAQVPFPTISAANCQVTDGGVGACEQLECYFDSIRGNIDFSGNGGCYGKRTSISDLEIGISDFFVYPNPTNDYVNVVSAEQLSCNIIVLNTLGQIVYEKENERGYMLTINTSNFENGVYLICLLDRKANKVSTKRFYKN